MSLFMGHFFKFWKQEHMAAAPTIFQPDFPLVNLSFMET